MSAGAELCPSWPLRVGRSHGRFTTKGQQDGTQSKGPVRGQRSDVRHRRRGARGARGGVRRAGDVSPRSGVLIVLVRVIPDPRTPSLRPRSDGYGGHARPGLNSGAPLGSWRGGTRFPRRNDAAAPVPPAAGLPGGRGFTIRRSRVARVLNGGTGLSEGNAVPFPIPRRSAACP